MAVLSSGNRAEITIGSAERVRLHNPSEQHPATKVLVDAVVALLPPIQAVIAAHPNDGTRRCARCRVSHPCPHLCVAIDALGLVLRTHRATRHIERHPSQPDVTG
jgi:hypothetical protein